MSSIDAHDGESPESPTTLGSLKATCIHPRRFAPVVKTLEILTVTLVFGSKLKMTNALSGSRRVSSSLLNMTPLVYSTQNGSKVVGEALGDAEGWLLGDALGVLLGIPLGVALGVADGEELGEALGDALGEALGRELGLDDGEAEAWFSVSKSHRPPEPEHPTMKL